MRACLLFTVLICSALAVPADVQHALVLRQRRELDVFANTKLLIEELVQNLRKAAADALEAIRIFESGLLEQAKQIQEKIASEIQNLRDRVYGAIQAVADKITGSGTAVRECIESHRSEADALLNDTMTKTLECADERIAEIGLQVDNLKNNTNSALEFANNALDEMRQCVEDNPSNVFTVGLCLGRIAVKTELKGIVYISQSGLAIARLNLALATIPAALEVCAGNHLVAAGVVTAKIVMNIGSCSASSVYNNLAGNAV